jgi:hypothetical protein
VPWICVLLNGACPPSAARSNRGFLLQLLKAGYGTKLTKPMRQARPQLAKADVAAK